MKLLFDENLSPRLLEFLSAIFPGSEHVELVGFRGQPDETIWTFAGQHGLCIVSKDNDFRQLSFLKGPPPKVIWLSIGNAGTEAISVLLKNRRAQIEAFQANADEALLVLEEAGA